VELYFDLVEPWLDVIGAPLLTSYSVDDQGFSNMVMDPVGNSFLKLSYMVREVVCKVFEELLQLTEIVTKEHLQVFTHEW